ncbi:hypothetical protein [Phytohabitans suffuscus]|nr:hypothetical protein [Phytohabitans suffuscus]
MSGPAQRYLIYGLQAARESTDPRAQLLAVGILADMARQMRWLGQPDTAVRMLDLALNQLPVDRSYFNTVRAILTSQRAWALAYHGRKSFPEVESALRLSFELHVQADNEDRLGIDSLHLMHLRPSDDVVEAELSATASCAYLVLARRDRHFGRKAEEAALVPLRRHGASFGRADVLSQIRLASVRFIGDEPEQACDDGEGALALLSNVTSTMVRARMRDLLADSEPHRALPRVNDLRRGIQAAWQ